MLVAGEQIVEDEAIDALRVCVLSDGSRLVGLLSMITSVLGSVRREQEENKTRHPDKNAAMSA
jgi:hypothetical protein